MGFMHLARRLAVGLLVMVAALAMPAAVAAHGALPDEPLSVRGLLFAWTVEPLVGIALVVATVLWWQAAHRVNQAHPANPVPRRRTLAFAGGLAAIAVALLSGIGRYDTTLFSVHMVQHILLVFVAAPLIALSGPVTLALRAVPTTTRRSLLLPILHSRPVRVVSHPVVAWLAFTSVMWGSHFSPLFDAALEDPLAHDLEHALFLGSGLLFWWPALGVDPAAWRMPPAVRALYVFLQMPQNTFLAVAITFATAPLYRHYATLAAPWLPSALADQQAAGAIMWLAGDAVFLVAVIGLVAAWMRADERGQAREDRRADEARAAIREREAKLAKRLGREGG
jgi:cytochrome c oxidase assembly factor CtaG